MQLHLRNLSYSISKLKKNKECTSELVFDEIDKFSDKIVGKWAKEEEFLWKNSQAYRIDKAGRWLPSTKFSI